MTAPSIYGSNSGVDTSNTTSESVILADSSFVDGQTVYIAIASDAVDSSQFGTASRFSGLTANLQVAQAIFNATARVYKQANIQKANESFSSPNYTFTVPCNTSERQAWFVFAVDGDGGIGAQGTDQSASSSTATIPGLTTTANNSLVIGIVFGDQVATPLGSASGYTKLGEISGTSAATVGVYYQTVATSGTSTGNQTVSLGASRAWRGISFEIKSAVTGGIMRPNKMDGLGQFFKGMDN